MCADFETDADEATVPQSKDEINQHHGGQTGDLSKVWALQLHTTARQASGCRELAHMIGCTCMPARQCMCTTLELNKATRL